MDDLSQTLASLRCVLSIGNKTADRSVEELSSLYHNLNNTKTKTCHEGVSTSSEEWSHSHSKEEPGRRSPSEGVMSLDISEYELQMLEQQARQEQLEEECILAFQVSATFSSSVLCLCHLLMLHDCYDFLQTQQASAPENSHETESDEELDDEMMKVKVNTAQFMFSGDSCRVIVHILQQQKNFFPI